ncbi:MAG TPA: glycosyltransferase family 2 protein [Usitatibacter sp.]|nr:glycosyltransferase family 2 protein [Usitatibacter sp.]
MAAPAGAPRVSILIPAYRERFFAEAFESARAQSASSFEIVVSDDSPGGAIRACVEAARDPRVRYFRNEPARGFEGNFTFLFREARGSLLKFLNDDDRLRPECVQRLAGAFDDPGVTLATSRRAVIDANGAPRADTPATTAITHLTGTIAGRELGDLALVNSINFIGEPTTVMFRRADLTPEARGLFTWGGKPYRCLADLALWLRLLAKGRAFYSAAPLSEFRIHPGQEQRAVDIGVGCITERLDLTLAARATGFLATPAQFRTALRNIDGMATMWRRHPGVPAAHVEELESLSRAIATLLPA